MMQQWSAELSPANALGISHPPNASAIVPPHTAPFLNGSATDATMNAYIPNAHFAPAVFSGSQEEFNRRTLTQEQFDAMERSGGMVDSLGNWQEFEMNFGGDQGAMNAMFPSNDFKSAGQGVYGYPIGAPMTSYDSTVPSNLSAESLPHFPSSTAMQTRPNMSANSSDWSGSRSSSIQEAAINQMQLQHAPAAMVTSQWQPGQSIPVDSTQQAEEFRQIRTQAQARVSPQQPMHEPLSAWSDDAFVRRGSSASLLAQSMSTVGLQTPPQPQNPTFKSPAPPANIAARRQRAPRPAALGAAALRSQSHSGAVQSATLSHAQPPQVNSAAAAGLRRIKSSTFMGAVAPGRVMKSTPGSAQRSPMHQNFADAMNSPHLLRHVSSQSHGSLAPPTPLSPKDTSSVEAPGQFLQWQSNVSRQASIAETDAEHAHSYRSASTVPAQDVSSPPHTPMYQRSNAQSRFNGSMGLENTPPQSAPAGQTCFSSNMFSVPQASQQQMHPPAPFQQFAHAGPLSQPFADAAMPDQQFQMSSVAFVPTQHGNVPTSVPGLPMDFANGVPMVNAAGDVTLYFPNQFQYAPEQQAYGPTPPQTMHTPPQIAYPFAASVSDSPSSQGSAPKAASADFFVHQYSPPDSVKRGSTPRRGPTDTVPKNYAFAHTGPEHYEEKKADDRKRVKSDAKDSLHSTSPASSSGTAVTL